MSSSTKSKTIAPQRSQPTTRTALPGDALRLAAEPDKIFNHLKPTTKAEVRDEAYFRALDDPEQE